MTAGEVMNRAASLLNDTPKTQFTYAAQIPYLNTAIDELQEEMELMGLSTTRGYSTGYAIGAGAGAIVAPLPTNLVEFQNLYEKSSGAPSTDYLEMTKVEFLPDLTATNSLRYWTYQEGQIRFVPANSARDVKIEYIGAIQALVVANTDLITILNSRSYLAFRTAGLVARFVGENPTRADQLDSMALQARDKLLGIGVKANQSMPVRRAPFMASYKLR